MATLGNVPAEAYTNTVKDSFSGNGSATAFTMSLPTVTNDVRVVVENVIQDPTVAYSVSGTTLTFTSAPPTGTNNIYVVHLGPAVMTTVPPAEIADATTFASSLTVQGAFTSQGIDDNGNATALTIDSSENVLISTTNVNPHQDGSGIALRESAGVIIGVDGTHAIIAARHNSDGEVIRIQKDNSTVGVIGTQGSRLSIGSGDVNLNFNASANSMYPISDPAAGTLSSGIVDLGAALATFKDAYLSGGVYLGGTGAANKLDDFEEGTWTPVITGTASTGTGTYVSQTGTYVKVGKLVHVTCRVSWTAHSGSGGTQIIGWPFTSDSSNQTGFHVMFSNMGTGGTDRTPSMHVGASSSTALLFGSQDATTWLTPGLVGNADVIFNGTYTVA